MRYSVTSSVTEMKKDELKKATTEQLAAVIAGTVPPVNAAFVYAMTNEELYGLYSENAGELFPEADSDGLLRLGCALELSRRLAGHGKEPPASIRRSSDAFAYLEPILRGLRQEHFVAVTLDAGCRVTGHTTVSVGTLTSAQAHARDVFRTAVIKNAHSVILAHNHPSGDPAPSREDLELTPLLADAGKILGIRVTDHIIVGDGRYFSFTDAGLIVL